MLDQTCNCKSILVLCHVYTHYQTITFSLLAGEWVVGKIRKLFSGPEKEAEKSKGVSSCEGSCKKQKSSAQKTNEEAKVIDHNEIHFNENGEIKKRYMEPHG